MSEVTCRLDTTSGTTFLTASPLRFVFRKELYTPYTHISLSAPVNVPAPVTEPPNRVRLEIDGHLLHDGLIETAMYQKQGENGFVLHVQSKGMTSLLMQNELTPGLHPSMSLNRLMTEYYQFPAEIAWESDDDRSNYIFVREHSSMWDGIINLAYKRFRQYPYIRGTNTICMQRTAAPSLITLTQHDIIRQEYQTTATHLVSDLHMQDINGSYDVYNRTSAEAVSMRIIRHKKLAFDRQYLSDPNTSLALRLGIATQGWRSMSVTCPYYAEADLQDLLTAEGICTERRIGGIRITGNAHGIETTCTVYEDAFTE